MDCRNSHIGVLMGGLSPERAVSLKSGRAVTDALLRLGYNATPIDVGRDLSQQLIQHGIEVALIALHGAMGEDGVVQGLLEAMAIPYTGSGVAASAICMDKGLSKRLYRDAGLPTPQWRELLLTANPDEISRAAAAIDLAPPLYVKPLETGSSVGVSPVDHPGELEKALTLAVEAAGLAPQRPVRVLVEQAAVGKEVTLAILDGQPLPFIEIHPLDGFFDYDNKYVDGRTEFRIPPREVSDAALERAREVALTAHDLLRCRGLARADLIIDDQETPWLLEINTIPGLTQTSLSPQAAQAAGLSFDQLVERILQGAALESCVA